MPQPVEPKSVAIRYLDGKSYLIIFTEDGQTMYELRPVHLLQLITEAGKVAWANYNIVDRELGEHDGGS